MPNFGRLSLAVAILLMAYVPPSAASDCMVFGNATERGDNLFTTIVRNVSAALKQADICMELKDLPALRSTQALQRGEIDGEPLRVFHYQNIVGDSAIRIEEPVLDGVGYMISRDPTVTSLAELGDTALGTLRGIVWQKLVAGDVKNVTPANSYFQLMEMFTNGRVGALLIDEFSLKRYSNLRDFHRVQVTRQQGFVYLNKSRVDRAEAIADAIRAFKERGCVFEEPRGGADCRAAASSF